MPDDLGELPDDLDAAVGKFKRYMSQRDIEMARERDATADAYRALPSYTVNETSTQAVPFAPQPDTRARSAADDDGDGSACHCTLAELQAIWGIGGLHHPDQVIKEYEQFPTAIVPGRTRVRGCLRFAKVDGSAITELNGPISSSARTALLDLKKSGCFAILFFGTKLDHGGGTTGGGRVGRNFRGSNEDFIIYLLICDH